LIESESGRWTRIRRDRRSSIRMCDRLARGRGVSIFSILGQGGSSRGVQRWVGCETKGNRGLLCGYVVMRFDLGLIDVGLRFD
jgi:hypothetical protein